MVRSSETVLLDAKRRISPFVFSWPAAVDIVGLGSKVEVYDIEFDELMKYTIVGSAEADPMNGRISNESPVGMALLGHKAGESITTHTPDGDAVFEIKSITK